MFRTRLMLAAVLLGAPAAAHAHALLRHASPAGGSTVHEAPLRLSIDFSEAVEPAFSSITVANAQGQHFEQGSLYVVGADRTHVAIDMKPLPPGTYTVTWHATAVDSHQTKGSYQFTVAP